MALLAGIDCVVYGCAMPIIEPRQRWSRKCPWYLQTMSISIILYVSTCIVEYYITIYTMFLYLPGPFWPFFWVTGNWEAYYSCWFCTSRSFAEDYINFMLGHLRHFRNISIDDKLSKLHWLAKSFFDNTHTQRDIVHAYKDAKIITWQIKATGLSLTTEIDCRMLQVLHEHSM